METSKTIDTLVSDIYGLFEGGNHTNKNLFEQFGDNLQQLVEDRFNPDRSGPPRLRMSNIGRPDKQVWMDLNSSKEPEAFTAANLIKFSYGDVIEQMMLLYARMAGHRVEKDQAEVEVNGVKGHIDAMIDGVVVDVKSASTRAFEKFETGSLLTPGNDPFGYVGQLAGYVEALTPGKGGAFLAVDKTLGKVTLLKVPASVLANYRVRDRIDYLKKLVKEPAPPSTPCYKEKPDGKSGNMKLDTGCSYCRHKFACWPNLKTYYYSTGPRYLTKVVKVPKVQGDFPDGRL